MMATVPHVTSGSGLRKFQADGFLLDRVYNKHPHCSSLNICTIAFADAPYFTLPMFDILKTTGIDKIHKQAFIQTFNLDSINLLN